MRRHASLSARLSGGRGVIIDVLSKYLEVSTVAVQAALDRHRELVTRLLDEEDTENVLVVAKEVETAGKEVLLEPKVKIHLFPATRVNAVPSALYFYLGVARRPPTDVGSGDLASRLFVCSLGRAEVEAAGALVKNLYLPLFEAVTKAEVRQTGRGQGEVGVQTAQT